MRRREFLLASATAFTAASTARGHVPAPQNRPKISTGTPTAASGPLRQHSRNPRYFADAEGRAVLLRGSHMWNNLVDMGSDDPPAAFDFATYLKFLKRYHHNFIRLWTWECTSWDTRGKSYGGPGALNHVAPHPFARTGPGTALDGKPKFDLTRFDQAYFDRLRNRIAAAGTEGIYVSVMLFEGWNLQFGPDAWKTHPFNPANNVNQIGADATGDGRGLKVHELTVPAVTQRQEVYVRKVVDTVNDLDNVLYEISNENHPASTDWQYHFINFIHQYEKRQPKQHPVGMTFQYKGGTNQTLKDSPADWISPNPDGGYRDNPPVNDGKQVVLTDTDHLWGIGGNPAWVWRSVFRGLNPLFMDPYDGGVLGKPFDPQWEPIRTNLGTAGLLLDPMDLGTLPPHNELASTRYCLAAPGSAYLVYAPGGGEISVDLSALEKPGRARWFDPARGTFRSGPDVRGGGTQVFRYDGKGDAILQIMT